jgi:uncharacterized protein YtpQ (UPF0354 family)
MSDVPTPWLSGTLAERAGALAQAAHGFLTTYLGENAKGFRGGPSGLVTLCEQLLRFLEREEVSEDEDRRFVEGAGALLGLLLIDHLGDGAHAVRAGVHRVRLGRFGFFDPFMAVERVLDAPNPRAELARQVALAEDEGRARGPVSRVVASLVSALERERPDLELRDHFDLTLFLQLRTADEPLEIDLRRAVESTRDQAPHAVENVTRRLLSMLPGAPEVSTDLEEARVRLVPRLVRGEALRDLSSSGKSLLAGAPLSGELSVALLLEYEGRARYVRERELGSWQVSFGDALALACENLAARSQTARVASTETVHGSLYLARTGDGRDSARVLLPSLYGELRARIGEHIALGIPHRDTFMACDAQNHELVEVLTARVREDAMRAPHRLSETLFSLSATGLHPLV